ncbi:MAG: fibronectin type III domain-containing protein, partial [Nitrospirae bacterium]|nr:fibronectin type III domain-containing protein [Nitrospirota bacterium]
MSILILVVILSVISIGATNSARAGQAILTWDPPTTNSDGSPLTDLAGYKVYYGTTSGNYSTVMDVSNVTSYTVYGLFDNTTYYFATTAYNTSSIESAYSGEVAKTTAGTSNITAALPDTTPPTGTITINNGDPYATSASAAITFSCSDAGSGCSQMRSSNTGNVWQNYVTSWTWTLSSGDGLK